MKTIKLISFLCFVLSFVANASGNWQNSGDNIFFDQGYVGIWTQNPEYPLDIAGNINLMKGEYGKALWVNGIEALYLDENKMFSWGYDGEINYFKNRIGIGTTSPMSKLHVQSYNVDGHHYDRYASSIIEGGEGRLQLIGVNGGVASAALILTNSIESANSHWSIVHLTSEHDNKLLIGHKTTESSPIDTWNKSGGLMTIDTNGNVGIGTQNPSAKLHVYGNILADGDILLDNDNYIAFENKFGEVNNTLTLAHITLMDRYSSINDVVLQNTLGGKIHFQTGEDGNASPKVTITNSGRVGIGTTSPQGTLHVNGDFYYRNAYQYADYVFESVYRLESIDEHSQFMWENKHLKAIPKSKPDANGQETVEVGTHLRGIVEELEKAHIYIEQLHSRINSLEERLEQLETKYTAID